MFCPRDINYYKVYDTYVVIYISGILMKITLTGEDTDLKDKMMRDFEEEYEKYDWLRKPKPEYDKNDPSKMNTMIVHSSAFPFVVQFFGINKELTEKVFENLKGKS